ncbi:MAG: hypothetical protein IK081_09620 [Lachnospiraceae bacterium]|nr:hypothetical protein [Lachnospiraceae bacterium]
MLDEERTYWMFSDISTQGFHWEYVMLDQDGTRHLVCEIWGKRKAER